MLLEKDIKEVLFSKEQIEARCKEVGAAITHDYMGKEPIFIGVLRGCVAFMQALLDNVDLYCTVDYITASSYHGTSSSGTVNIVRDVLVDVKDRDIIIVEDILDRGLTLDVITKMFLDRGARSVRIAALLVKKIEREINIKADYYCFDVENQFVVGFGLDYNQLYRNLPYIGVLKPELYER